MDSRLALLVAVLALAAGCLGNGDHIVEPATAPPAAHGITTLRERAALPFAHDGDWSSTLQHGPYGILDPLGVYVDVPIPAGSGLPLQQAHLGLFLPDIAGCDWTAASLPETCKVPVIADFGPYYGDGDSADTQPAGRLGKFLIDNFVPYGYAVAQASVLGTGQSIGCMDLMGKVEQAGIHTTVEWLGTQPWGNGNVALIGRSYDGSTPWEAAMAGSEHLKTIVPISGLKGVYDLMWRNGSAETRAPGALWAIYWLDGFQGEQPPLQVEQAVANLACPESLAGLPEGLAAYATGDRVVPMANPYWVEREFWPTVLEHYKGSVYFIHGLQDWNVDNHQAFPLYQMLQEKGLEVKGLFGQWQHMYPDRPSEHESCNICPSNQSVRWDWAQDLLEWFDHYLKGSDAAPELHVEVQDDRGAWRVEPTYPPPDAEWRSLEFGKDLQLASTSDIVAPGLPVPAGPLSDAGAPVVLKSEPLAQGTRIAGMPQLHLTVTPFVPGGQLFAELRDATDDRRIGHAVMDLRFAAGGEDSQPVVPQQPLLVQMEFWALDTVVPAGHVLELVLTNTGDDYLPSVVSGPVQVHVDQGSVLRLPVVHRGADAFFAPPADPTVEPFVDA